MRERIYNFGAATMVQESSASADADGDTFTLGNGDWLLCISGEAVEVAAGAITVAAGAGTLLKDGTQLHIRVPVEQSWAVRSAGGTGRITFTRMET